MNKRQRKKARKKLFTGGYVKSITYICEDTGTRFLRELLEDIKKMTPEDKLKFCEELEKI